MSAWLNWDRPRIFSLFLTNMNFIEIIWFIGSAVSNFLGGRSSTKNWRHNNVFINYRKCIRIALICQVRPKQCYPLLLILVLTLKVWVLVNCPTKWSSHLLILVLTLKGRVRARRVPEKTMFFFGHCQNYLSPLPPPLPYPPVRDVSVGLFAELDIKRSDGL